MHDWPHGVGAAVRVVVMSYHQLASTAISLAYFIKFLASDMVGYALSLRLWFVSLNADVVRHAKLPCHTNGQIYGVKRTYLPGKSYKSTLQPLRGAVNF